MSAGDSAREFSDAFDTSQYNWGGSITFMGGGVFGIEGDFGFSPDFYGKTDVGSSNVFTATGNLVIGIPFGGQQGFGIRPYGVAGAGLMKSKSDFGTGVAEIDENDPTWSAGGGARCSSGAAQVSVSDSATSRRSTIRRSSASRSPSRPGRSISRELRWVSCSGSDLKLFRTRHLGVEAKNEAHAARRYNPGP